MARVAVGVPVTGASPAEALRRCGGGFAPAAARAAAPSAAAPPPPPPVDPLLVRSPVTPSATAATTTVPPAIAVIRRRRPWRTPTACEISAAGVGRVALALAQGCTQLELVRTHLTHPDLDPQAGQRPRAGALHRPDRNTERGRGVLLGQVAVVAQHDDCALAGH